MPGKLRGKVPEKIKVGIDLTIIRYATKSYLYLRIWNQESMIYAYRALDTAATTTPLRTFNEVWQDFLTI